MLRSYIVFIDAGFEEEFRRDLEQYVEEYFIVPRVLAWSQFFNPMLDTVVWPGHMVAILFRTEVELGGLFNKWREKLKGKGFRVYAWESMIP